MVIHRLTKEAVFLATTVITMVVTDWISATDWGGTAHSRRGRMLVPLLFD